MSISLERGVASRYTFGLRQEPDLSARFGAFPYQEDAVHFVASKPYAAVFHEQGLGKTKIAIDVGLSWLRSHEVDTLLVFTKKSLVANWRREFERHSNLRPLVLSDESNRNYYVFTTPARLVLANFEVAKKEERRLRAWIGSRRVAVFVDESQKIKNPHAALTQVFLRLSPLFCKRVILTGTPVANRPYDIWAQIHFLDGGRALGVDFAQFKRDTDLSRDHLSDPEALASYQTRLAAIHRQIHSFSVRETKDGGRVSLPSKEFVRLDCTWEAGQAELYRQVREELRAVVMRDGQLLDEDEDVILKRLLRLVQIASNPALVDEAYRAAPGKLPALRDLLTDITRQGDKAIVWTSFVANSKWLADSLRELGALALNGSMPIERREEVISWFLNNPEDRVLVATPGAAKEGLTLTAANHVIFYDRTYSLDDYLQAQDRIHRLSQAKTCFVYNLIMQDSIDEWIDALLEQKRLAAQLTQGDIDANTYASHASLSFIEILRGILAATEHHTR
jgi:SNF2 family DNA or RNA helicase